jgi:uncharacterized protein (DUF111 family)
MIVGALLDAGLELEALERELAKLKLDGYTLSARRARRGGFRCTKFDVKVSEQRHAHGHGHKCEHKHEHGGSSLADILGRIDSARSLSEGVRKSAGDVFKRLAAAEARAHGTSKGRIHFHEVGAIDAIVDVVGAMIGLELLGVEAVYVSVMTTGSGYIDCAHGRLPVPSPATAYLLEGFSVRGVDSGCELTTPTGAGIAATLASSTLWPAHQRTSAAPAPATR